MSNPRWLNVAAFATWFVCGLPPLAELAAGTFGGWPGAIWLAAFLSFGVALAACLTPPSWLLERRRWRLPALVVQSITGLTMIHFSGNGTSAATLVLVAAELPYFTRRVTVWLWVAIQTLALGISFGWLGAWIDGVTVAVALGGFQVFAMTSSFLAISERSAREALTRTNAELLATRSLLAESSRVAERLRIARDLHDALGHHLTALSLQLDVASRKSSGEAADHVREAHAITRLLLSDVRDVVSEMRQTSRIDVAEAIRALVVGIGPLQVHLDVPTSLPVDDTGHAHALLRSVQEIITNASRHGGASHLWIRLERTTEGITLHARDDGRGSTELTWGNGLKGMRERFEQHSGHIEFTPGPGQGFEVHGFLPRPETAS